MIKIKQKSKCKKTTGILALAVGLLLFAAIPIHTAPSASAAIRPYYYVDTPSISAAVNTDKGVKLTWAPIEDADKYRVFMKNGNSWKKLGDTTGTVFYHKDAVSGTTYTYTVRCVSEDGSYFTSNYLPAGKTITYIAMPVISRLNNLEDCVNITWNPVAGAEKYRVFNKIGTAWKKIGDTTDTSFRHTAAVSGQSYTYTVRCISADGKSYTSAYYTAGHTISYVKAPFVTEITDEPDGVRLSWDACDGADKYRVYIRSGESWKAIADTTETSYLHEADNDTEYVYTLRCFNAKGKAVSWYHEEGWTHLHSFTGSMDAPVITGFSNTENGVKITWKPVKTAENYRVLLLNGETWTPLGDTAETSFFHTDAESGTTYTYTVCCMDETSTRYTSVYDSEGMENRFIKPPVIQSVANTSNGAMISWSTSKGADRYRLIAVSGNDRMILADTTLTKYLHTNGAEGASYTYQVYCIDENGIPLHEVSAEGYANEYAYNDAAPVYLSSDFQADVCAVLGVEDNGMENPNAPLTRSTVSEILVRLLRYKSRTNITVSDATDDAALMTAAYYGYFTPDSKYRVLPDRIISEAEYSRLMGEVERYARLRGKRILAFGDSIMYGKGNGGGGIARLLAEKYGMTFYSYAANGASFGTYNSRRHISDEILDAYKAERQADLILINGGTNDMILSAKGSYNDYFDPRRPNRSTLAMGMKQSFEYLKEYWKDVPVIYVRAHNMDVCSDTLERQMGEYAVATAAEYGATIADIYTDTTLHTKSSTQTARYTYDPSNPENADGVHPNAIGYNCFYLPMITEKAEALLTQ